MNRHTLLTAIALLYGAALLAALFSILPHRKKTGKYASGRVAVVHIYGPISTGFSVSPWASPGADEIARRLHRLSADEQVKAIVLRINSPGGAVGAVQEIDEEVLRCKAHGKKVVASLGDVAASGGYYLASSADRVIADSGTITGSIGVIMEFGNLEGLFQKLGVKLEVVKSGAHKDIGSPARPLTPEERTLLQASIDDAYDQFVNAVARGRRLPLEKVRALADGRIFTGRQALAAGLVDALGDRQDALEEAARLANLPPEPRVESDSAPSLRTVLKRFSSESEGPGWKVFSDRSAGGPALEYRWQ